MCERGIAIVAVLSNLEWAEKFADRIVGLSKGASSSMSPAGG
jgi:ABC-type phosphate/phosphonate transport system, ATPase component